MGKKITLLFMMMLPGLCRADFETFTKNVLLPCGLGVLAAKSIDPNSNDGWAYGCMITVVISDSSSKSKKPSREDLEIRLQEAEKRPVLPSY